MRRANRTDARVRPLAILLGLLLFATACDGGSPSPAPTISPSAGTSLGATIAPTAGASDGGPSAGSSVSPSVEPTASSIASPSVGPSVAAGRPSSPAEVAVTSPKNGATVTGSTVHVTVSVMNAEVVQQTSLNISPTQGHVHLYLDNALVYMAYTLEQDLPVTPGTYTLRAEFVASDHAPFNPRVWSKAIIFTVK